VHGFDEFFGNLYHLNTQEEAEQRDYQAFGKAYSGSLDGNTIVWYSTDNGPEHSSWPHGGTTPFRGEKMTTYEGGVRVISMLRWPGVIEPGQVMNGIQSHMECSPASLLQPACRTSAIA
jgi:arylsulfatase A-like enzyme